MSGKSANPIDKIIGKKIAVRRKALGLSQSSLAQAVGLTFQQIQKYEGGINRVSAGRLYQIAEVLQVPVLYFYEGLHQAPPVEESPSDAAVIGQALENISGASRRKLATKLVLALLCAFETV